MTANEAIKILEVAKAECEWNAPLDYQEAFDLAISALQAQEVKHSTESSLTQKALDTISRQAAIDAIGKASDELYENIKKGATFPQRQWFDGMAQAQSILENLPSAQPEPCEDAVSRRKLLNDLRKLITAWKKYPVMAEQIKGVETAIGYVEAIPSVTSKRKTRKWIEYDSDEDKYDVIKCPCCKHTFTVDAYHWTDIGFVKDDFKFCPNCGANMNGGEQE